MVITWKYLWIWKKNEEWKCFDLFSFNTNYGENELGAEGKIFYEKIVENKMMKIDQTVYMCSVAA